MGTVGNLAVILPNVPVVTANRAVSIISPRAQDEFNSYFLAIYLESKYGVAQRERESMGGVQERVNLDDLARIKIPVLSMSQQQIVVDIFQKALTGHLDSRLFYQQAEKLLLKEIGLADFKQRENLSFAVNLSEVTDADRVDADFFQPKYKEILEKLKGVQTDALKNYFQILRSKSFGYHDEGKVGVIKTKQVGKQFLDFGGYQSVHRTYGGEFYIDSKWWMFGSNVVVDPRCVGWHLASSRGYSYNHDSYIENVLGNAYALGMDDWRARAYINWMRRGRKEVLDAIMKRNEIEHAKDREFIAKKRKMTFNELIVSRPWSKLNIEMGGTGNDNILIFLPTWLNLLKESPEYVKDAYQNDPKQEELNKFIVDNLYDFVYHGNKFDKNNLPKI